MTDAKAKEVSSAAEFMARLGSKTELYEVEGLTVRIRSLGYEDAQAIGAGQTNGLEAAFQALVLGLVEPKFDEEQLIALRKAKPGPLLDIARRIMEISGMMEGSGPLAGDGSSVLTPARMEPSN
jgi:hypothetical protein